MILGKDGTTWRTVPPIADRGYIMHQIHTLAYIHPDRLY